MRQKSVGQELYAFGKGIEVSIVNSINIESVMRESRSGGGVTHLTAVNSARRAGQDSAHTVTIGRSKE